eukprot:SAG22_NODE_1468_length_4349_cov_2.069882_1_plen_209_part_00
MGAEQVAADPGQAVAAGEAAVEPVDGGGRRRQRAAPLGREDPLLGLPRGRERGGGGGGGGCGGGRALQPCTELEDQGGGSVSTAYARPVLACAAADQANTDVFWDQGAIMPVARGRTSEEEDEEWPMKRPDGSVSPAIRFRRPLQPASAVLFHTRSVTPPADPAAAEAAAAGRERLPEIAQSSSSGSGSDSGMVSPQQCGGRIESNVN